MTSPGRHAVSIVRRWWVGFRPFAYPASAMAVAVGAALAAYAGHPVKWGLLGLTLLGVLCFHTAANLLNDAVDHRRGLDTRVYPSSGAVVRGWLTEAQAMRGAAVLLGIGTVCGLVLAWQAGWVVLLLGVAGGLLAGLYSTPRWGLKYAGVGDLAIFLAFGVLTVFGTWWVQAGRFDWLPVVWSVPVAMLTVGILHANNWRDIASDRARGCLTLAGRLGPEGSRLYYRVLVLGAFVLAGILVVAGRLSIVGLRSPFAVLAVFLALPLALKLAMSRKGAPADPALDARTAMLHLVFGLLCAGAFAFG